MDTLTNQQGITLKTFFSGWCRVRLDSDTDVDAAYRWCHENISVPGLTWFILNSTKDLCFKHKKDAFSFVMAFNGKVEEIVEL